MHTIVLKPSWSKTVYPILLVLLYISFSNCNLSKLYAQNDMPTPCNVVTNCAQETTLTTKNRDSILVCFDVDDSMLKKHMHNALANRCELYTSDNGLWVMDKGQIQLQDDRTQANPNYNPDHVKEMTKRFLNYIPIRDQEDLKSLIVNLLDEGHQVAITTFSAYPDSIKIILQQLGLNQDQINRIPIIGGFPKRGHNDPNRKMEHIEQAKALTDINCNSNVILVDDSEDNIKAAAKNGVAVVLVEGVSFSWIQVKNKVKNLVTSLEAQRHDQVPTTSRNEDDQKTEKKETGDKLSNIWKAIKLTTF